MSETETRAHAALPDARPRVGFIGLGIMGRHMARNLMRAGFPLHVWNRTRAKAEALAAEGALIAGSPAELASQVDVVCTCVTGPDDLLAVVSGPEGVARGARAGLLHVDLTTATAEAAQAAARALAEAGAAFVDAPVTGGETGARDATLTIMVGGAPDDVARARPVLAALGSRIVHMGPVGAGQTTKLVANMIGGVALLGACEGIAMGLRAGLDLDRMLEVFENSSARSASLSLVAERVRTGRFEPGFSVKNRYKDFVLALEAGLRLGVVLPGAAVATQLFAAAMARGFAERDQAALYHVIRALNGEEAEVPTR